MGGRSKKVLILEILSTNTNLKNKTVYTFYSISNYKKL